VNHHVASHLAGDAGRRGHPADNLAVVAIEGEAMPRRKEPRIPDAILDQLLAGADANLDPIHQMLGLNR
jgi:hypothetical protein